MRFRWFKFLSAFIFASALLVLTFAVYGRGDSHLASVKTTRLDPDEGDKGENGEPDADNPIEGFKWRHRRMQDEHGNIAPGSHLAALNQRAAVTHAHSRIAGDNWVEVGPTNLMGRAISIICSPSSDNVVIVGTAGGGVWKTLDGGSTWSRLGDAFSSLAVGSLAYDPTNESTIYAGTGEGYFNSDAIPGIGIYKSTNGGQTWTILPGTSGFQAVNRIAIDPSNNKHILAGVSYGGIYQSTDGGQTWSNPHFAQGGRTLEFNSKNSSNVLATVLDYNFTTNEWLNQVLTSNDGGTTWAVGGLTVTGQNGGFYSRMEAKYVPGSSSNVLLSLAQYTNDSNQSEGGVLYSSTNGGTTFSQVTTSGNATASWYNNDLWIDPTNANRVVIAGTYTYGSTDGGATISQISNGYILTQDPHPDNHAFAAPFDYDGVTHKTLFVLTDGGVYKTTDITTAQPGSGWIACAQGANTAQFYSIGGDGKAGIIFGGTQDNGTLAITTTNTQAANLTFGGDGGFVAMDPTNTNNVFGEYIDLEIFRSTSGALNSNATYITNGLGDAGGNADFIAPFIMDPNAPSTLLAGGASVWRTVNATSSNPSWSSIRGPSTANISAIAVATGNSNIIYVGQDDGTVAMTTNGTAATPTWTTVGSGVLPARTCTRLLVDPANSSLVYATFGGFTTDNVWESSTGGSTWQAITGSGSGVLPNTPVYAIARNPNNPQDLYVGTEVGIFSTSNGGSTWSTTNDGPNDAEVYDLKYLNNSTQMVAGTHGRGIWVLDTGGAQLSTLTLTPSTVQGGNSVNAVVTLKAAAPSSGTVIGIFSSGAASASMPSSVTISAGQTSASFTIATTAVTSTETASVTVQLGTSTLSQNLSIVQTLGADKVISLQLQNPSVIGGSSDTATVTLASAAPSGGQVVNLASSNQSYVAVPATVTVLAGATTANFTVTTKPYTSTYQASMTASDTAGASSTKITVVNDTLQSLAFAQTTVEGGYSTTATVTLTSAAPTQGWTVNLAASNATYIGVPSSVVVPSGATTATFTVTTKAYTSTYQASVTGSCPFSAKQATLTVAHESIASFTVSPTNIVGGSTPTGTVTLTSAAPTGGWIINLASSNATYVGVPASVTVLAGKTAVSFPITTKAYTSTYSASITASFPGSALALKITVQGDSLQSVTFTPNPVVGGSVSTGTVTLASAAPTGGWVVNLSSANSTVAKVPASVTVAAGATTATFSATTTAVSTSTGVVITGSDSLTTHKTTLTVNP